MEIKVLNPPRPGKKLLVIDIDYTIFDLGSSAEQPMDLARCSCHPAAYEEHVQIQVPIHVGDLYR